MHTTKSRETEDDICIVSGNPCTCLTGQPSLDDIQCYPKSNFYNKSLSKAQRENHLRKSFAGLEAATRGADHDDFEEESSSAALSELFHGFLAIGTLGTDPLLDDPSTPTFSISVENIAEKDTEVTENELKLINDELEKVLGAEAKDDGCNLSSGRNSYVSTGRSSHGSTITLSGKQFESSESNGNGTTVCPLQGYLFGSTVGWPETTPASAKKEHRPSLGELFQKTKLAEENYGAKYEKRTDKDSDKSAVHLMKKILKKKMLHASSRNSVASGGTVDSVSSAETKPHKVGAFVLILILQMFHRKVHPESSIASSQKPDKSSKNERPHDRGGLSLDHDDITIIPHHRLSKASIKVLKGHSNMQQFTLDGDLNENRECWIKTDADCE
ncbi:putative Polyprotein [Capsicum annuum]|nr:putative Polyprotein [Capsicum annuum]